MCPVDCASDDNDHRKYLTVDGVKNLLVLVD